VTGLLAEISGLAPAGVRIAPRELVAGFDLARISRAPARLPDERLAALAG
jgi:hypothetical protein